MKSKQTTQCLAVHIQGLFCCDNHSDHINSHRQTWNTWKHWFQRVPESKWNGAKTPINHQKLSKKSLLTSLDMEMQYLNAKSRPFSGLLL